MSWNVLFLDLGAGYIYKNSSSCTLMIYALTVLTFKKAFTLKRKPSVHYLNSTSVFIWRKDLHQQASCRGSMPSGKRGWGLLLSPSLLPPPASCCFWGREHRKWPERSSHLTGTMRWFLTLGAWWIFKGFSPMEHFCGFSGDSLAVSLPLQLPSHGQCLSSSWLFPILPHFLLSCRLHGF